jgi:hypothetical protein
MSKKIIKMPHDVAKGKIVTQHDLGVNIIKSGIKVIDERRSTSRTEVDAFQLKYEHWRDITSEVLNEVFLSRDYAYKFRNKISSQKKYVSYSWQPDIQYYITKEMQPKIQYLKLLAENIMAYDEDASKDISETKDKEPPTNLENYTVIQLIGLLKPIQFKSAVALAVTIIITVFYFGYEVNSWKQNNDNYHLTNENNLLKEDITKLKNKLTSTENNKEVRSDNK